MKHIPTFEESVAELQEDMTKIHDVTITVTLNGRDVKRDYKTEDLDNVESLVMGDQVLDMLNTLREADKNVGL